MLHNYLEFWYLDQILRDDGFEREEPLRTKPTCHGWLQSWMHGSRKILITLLYQRSDCTWHGKFWWHSGRLWESKSFRHTQDVLSLIRKRDLEILRHMLETAS